MNDQCTKSVTDYTGYHFSQCKNKAKWRITSIATGRIMIRCGIHARRFDDSELYIREML
jgi:hypothetical protein